MVSGRVVATARCSPSLPPATMYLIFTSSSKKRRGRLGDLRISEEKIEVKRTGNYHCGDFQRNGVRFFFCGATRQSNRVTNAISGPVFNFHWQQMMGMWWPGRWTMTTISHKVSPFSAFRNSHNVRVYTLLPRVHEIELRWRIMMIMK